MPADLIGSRLYILASVAAIGPTFAELMVSRLSAVCFRHIECHVVQDCVYVVATMLSCTSFGASLCICASGHSVIVHIGWVAVARSVKRRLP